jgi:hypothetical protein
VAGRIVSSRRVVDFVVAARTTLKYYSMRDPEDRVFRDSVCLWRLLYCCFVVTALLCHHLLHRFLLWIHLWNVFAAVRHSSKSFDERLLYQTRKRMRKTQEMLQLHLWKKYLLCYSLFSMPSSSTIDWLSVLSACWCLFMNLILH